MRINEAVRNMTPPRYTRTQAAALVGRSVDTVVRWRDEGIYQPSETKQFGTLVVDLYTPDDITEMRKIARTMKPGRQTASA